MDKTIFIVEKYVFFKLTLENFVRKNDFKVIGWENNNLLAMDKILELRPNYIILDKEVFGEDIIDVIQIIKHEIPNIRIIVTLNKKNKFLIKALIEEEVSNVFVKPFTETKFINSIKENDWKEV